MSRRKNRHQNTPSEIRPLCQHRRDEKHIDNFHELGRLKLKPTDGDPVLRPVVLRSDEKDQHQKSQPDHNIRNRQLLPDGKPFNEIRNKKAYRHRYGCHQQLFDPVTHIQPDLHDKTHHETKHHVIQNKL